MAPLVALARQIELQLLAQLGEFQRFSFRNIGLPGQLFVLGLLA